jgi:hypothetical protein
MSRVPHHLKRLAAARVLFIAGASCLVLTAFLQVAAHSIFDAEIFGQRTAASLSDPGVAGFVSDAIATAVVRSQPDLITVRPLILAASNSLLATYPFQTLAGAAARRRAPRA